ncbi:MAG TPA: hypothetical protein VKY42_05145 [Trueperaceae bacterium]|nr:hypothetical protein [Trueperaceae bacterium]
MTDAGRFERGEQYAVVDGVVTHRGVDPVTGLDVLIYDFPGAPTVAAGVSVSDHALKVLVAETRQGPDGASGHLVAAYPTGAALVAPGESAVDYRFVLQALQGLKEAHAKGVVHGDITPSRLLYGLGEVFIEGFGVPWRAGSRPADERAAMRADVVALARSLLALAGDNLSTEVTAALRSAEAANPPMTAERLHAIVKRLAGGAVTVPAAGFTDLTLPTVPTAKAEARPAPPAAPEAPRPAASPAGAAVAASVPAGAAHAAPAPRDAPVEDPEPITLHSDPGLGPQPRRPSPKDTSPGFVKAPPPGAKYRHGSLEDGPRPAPIRVDREERALERTLTRSRRSWRGPALLLLMLLVAGLAAYLAVLNRDGQGARLATPGENFLVDVAVQPANMPPVQLVVVQSPPGSRNPPGTVMTSVPRAVTFDVAGTWVVQGRFQRRETPPVTLQVPDDRAITLVFPPQEE